ncbi:Phosphoglucomutase/phosphomannomutase [Spironucleus salmonicida]|nr:Phosphoglucomutase/phosphomannomutase [Spironucleus salmonicida]
MNFSLQYYYYYYLSQQTIIYLYWNNDIFIPSGTEPKVKYYVEATSKVSCEDAQKKAVEFTKEFLKAIGK